MFNQRKFLILSPSAGDSTKFFSSAIASKLLPVQCNIKETIISLAFEDGRLMQSYLENPRLRGSSPDVIILILSQSIFFTQPALKEFMSQLGTIPCILTMDEALLTDPQKPQGFTQFIADLTVSIKHGYFFKYTQNLEQNTLNFERMIKKVLEDLQDNQPSSTNPPIPCSAILPPVVISADYASAAHHPMQQKMINACPVVVFDFDCTLTTRHFFHFVNSGEYKSQDGSRITYPSPLLPEDLRKCYLALSAFFESKQPLENIKLEHIKDVQKCLIDHFWGGEKRLKKLKSFLKELLLKGCQLRIASRGKETQMAWCLKLVGLDQFFLTSNISGGKILKNKLLEQWIRTHSILYIDDDHTEHNNFLKPFDEQNKRITPRLDAAFNHGKQTTAYVFFKTLPLEGSGIDDAMMMSILAEADRLPPIQSSSLAMTSDEAGEIVLSENTPQRAASATIKPPIMEQAGGVKKGP